MSASSLVRFVRLASPNHHATGLPFGDLVAEPNPRAELVPRPWCRAVLDADLTAAILESVGCVFEGKLMKLKTLFTGRKANPLARKVVPSALMMGLLFAQTAAHADLGTMLTNGNMLAQKILTFILYGGVVIGAAAIVYAGTMMWKKAGDRGDDITWNKIMLVILGGGVLSAASFFMVQIVSSMGGTQSDIGRTITLP